MSEPDLQISKVKSVVDLADKHSLAELTVTEGDLTIVVKRTRPQVPATSEPNAQVHYLEEPEELEAALEADQPEQIAEDLYEVVAPLVGVFYRTPTPDAPNFVEIGDVVEVGQELALIEAMKVFSPVPSDVAGEIVDLPVKNGTLVHQGDILVRIRISVS